MLYGGNFDSRRVRGFKWGGDTGRVGVGTHGKSPGGGGGQRSTTADRGGGPGSTDRPKKQPQTLPSSAAAAVAPTPPPLAALRTATDLQNYFSDLQNIALGGQVAQQALARFGTAPEQSYFQYRESFPEFGDLSGTPGGLAGIIRRLGNMPRTAEKFAEGGRVGESMERRDIQTDVGKFGQMLRDLMLMPDEPTGRQADRLAQVREENYFSPANYQREGGQFIPGGLMPRVDQTIEVSPLPPPGMSRERTQRERELARVRRMPQAERDLMEDVRNEPDITEEMPPVPGERPEVPSRGALSYLLDMLRFEDVPYPYTVRNYETDSSFLLSVDEMTNYKALRDEGYSSEEALSLVKEGYAKGGPVSSRNEALPMVEGDHVVPAKAVKGNEGGLASLSRRLSGNPSYDGMIRGPGGPREDAIKTRVYAAGGGISGMMDNLQNPFNSVPARVSNKEYVIPRDAINNLGRMAGVSEGMANKAGQDIIYQLVENLKRKA